MNKLTFITGRESVGFAPKAKKAATEVAGYFSPTALTGTQKNVAKTAEAKMSPAVESYVASHAGINPVNVDSAKSGAKIEYLG